MSGMHLVDTLEVNSVFWIRSLDDDEASPSRRMVADLTDRAALGRFAFEEATVSDRVGLLELLNEIAVQAGAGLRPILHFDCHGSRDDGLLLRPSGEYLAWNDLVVALRRINVATRNNLCCIFGVCFGLRLSMSLRLAEPSPYYLTIAPEEEVSVGVLEARTTAFYDSLYESGNITAAYEAVLRPELKIFLCKEVFARALATYIADHCSGVGSRARRERMVTAVLTQAKIITPTTAQLADARRKVKAALEPSQALIDMYAPNFLIGRQPGFGFTELRQLANAYIERNRRRAERAMKTGGTG